jgi:hypothetical protein
MCSQIIAIIGTLLGIITGALLTHFLESHRNKNKILLDKKIEVYSNILVELNTVFQATEANLGLDKNSLSKLRTKIAATLSAGRLLAGKELEEKLRHYHEVAIEFWENGNDDGTMANLVIEIEQLMRHEIGPGRAYPYGSS